MTYTQRQWDRVVGWGKVPSEYKYEKLKEPYIATWHGSIYNVKLNVTFNMKVKYNGVQS